MDARGRIAPGAIRTSRASPATQPGSPTPRPWPTVPPRRCRRSTGNRPREDKLPIGSDHPHNYFTLLGDRYDFNVQEPITDLVRLTSAGRRRAIRGAAGSATSWPTSAWSRTTASCPTSCATGCRRVDPAFSDFAADGPDRGGGTSSFARRPPEHRREAFARFVRGIGSRRPTDPRLLAQRAAPCRGSTCPPDSST